MLVRSDDGHPRSQSLAKKIHVNALDDVKLVLRPDTVAVLERFLTDASARGQLKEESLQAAGFQIGQQVLPGAAGELLHVCLRSFVGMCGGGRD